MAAAEEIAPMISLAAMLRAPGFVRLRPAAMQQALQVPAAALEDFASSWERLETDGFMADGGRYRRRRHANFIQGDFAPRRGLHRPHFQASVHNSLNGGVDRWFAPVEDGIGAGPVVAALLGFGAAALPPGRRWFIEMHQFRIEAEAGLPGYPTPEGVHHDGVDFVLISMIRRTNLAGGETLVTDSHGEELARFTLDGLLDTAFLDDDRTMHGVTPIEPTDPRLPSRRDVLVITWKRLV